MRAGLPYCVSIFPSSALPSLDSPESSFPISLLCVFIDGLFLLYLSVHLSCLAVFLSGLLPLSFSTSLCCSEVLASPFGYFFVLPFITFSLTFVMPEVSFFLIQPASHISFEVFISVTFLMPFFYYLFAIIFKLIKWLVLAVENKDVIFVHDNVSQESTRV